MAFVAETKIQLRLKTIAVALRLKSVAIRRIGQDELTVKRGTDIPLEVTFTDADGNLYDPDTNTAKLQVKKPDGTTYTGYAFTDNKYLTKISTGVYRITFQTAVADPVGLWTLEVQGATAPNTSMNDIKVLVRA
jgi:hypothetical protein